MKKNLKKQSSNTNLPNKKKKVNNKSHKQKKRVVRKKLTIKKNKKNKIINKNNETFNFKKMIGGVPERDVLLNIINEGFDKIKKQLKDTQESSFEVSIIDFSNPDDEDTKNNISKELDTLFDELKKLDALEEIYRHFKTNFKYDGYLKDINEKMHVNFIEIMRNILKIPSLNEIRQSISRQKKSDNN